MWFWHILTPKQNKFIENSVNSNKFLFEMDGTVQPMKFLKINLKTHKSDRIWNASWHSSSNDFTNKDNNNKEKEKEKEDHDKLRHLFIFFNIVTHTNFHFFFDFYFFSVLRHFFNSF